MCSEGLCGVMGYVFVCAAMCVLSEGDMFVC